MIKISTVVELDLSCTAPRARINAKQGDGGTRQIVARFTNGSGVISDLSTVTSAELKVLRPDGVTVKAAATLSDGSATATLTAEMLAVAGRAFGDVVLYGDGESISAARFDINIMAAADSGIAPEPTPEPQDSGKPALASAVADGLFGAVGHAERVTVAKYDISGLEWEQGWYSASNSNSGTSVGEIRTTLYLDISGLTDFLNYTYTVKGQCGDKQCKFGVMFYDADFNVIKPTGNVTDWTTYGTQVKYTLGAAPTYARFTLQNPNGYSQSMAPSELTSATFEVYP